MALSYSLATAKLGNISASSLVKSAQTLTNELSTYNDTLERIQFENNPSDAQLSKYLTYLQGRINTLQASDILSSQTKALGLTQAMHTAIQTNTSFNIQNESIQVLTGNATDQQKLDYIGQAYQRAAGIGDVKLAQSLESQAYTLQQSIAYHQQAQQTANEVAYGANESALKQGYQNAIDALDSSWKTITTTFKNGGAGEVQSALADFTKHQAPIFKQLGVQLPQGAQLTMASVAQAVLHAKAAYYENGAIALGSLTNPTGVVDPNVQVFQQKARDILSGNTTIETPAGSMNLFGVNKWAESVQQGYGLVITHSNAGNGTNNGLGGGPLYSPVTDANGNTTLKENAISGYKVIKGQVIPESTGSAISTFDSLPKTVQNGLKTRLNQLGFTVVGTDSEGIKVQLTNETAKWMGAKNGDLMPGDTINLIATNGGKGFQLLSNSGKVYGLSFDRSGNAGLYGLGSNGAWSLIHSQPQFNAQTTNQTVPEAVNGAPSDVFHFVASTIPSHIASAVESVFGMHNTAPAPTPAMKQRAGGGFNFTNANGQSISAATYAHLTNTPFRTLLQRMANSGDAGAAQTLHFVGNDFGYDPTKISQGNNANLYNAMTWGYMPNAHVSGPSMSVGQLTLPSGLRL